jgi:phosphate transport system substrate-binding protein
MKTHLHKAVFFLILFLHIIKPSEVFPADYLTASGCSISNTGYLTELANEYERRTGIRIYIRGGGSVVGIEDLRSGRVDFAAACRGRSADDPADIQFIQVAWDALVFIVHKSNPAENISVESVREIYSGRITNWKKLKGNNAPIKIFLSRPKKGLSGVEASIRDMVLKGENPVETPDTVSVASTGIVEQMVEDTPAGFATAGFTSARKRTVKMLKVNGVYPTIKTIINNRYPLKRPLYLLTPKQSKPGVRQFVDFVLSREGQRFLGSLGVVSLSAIRQNLRE